MWKQASNHGVFKLFWNCHLSRNAIVINGWKVTQKDKESKVTFGKYVHPSSEHMVKEYMTDKDFIEMMKVCNCMISAYDEINQEIGLFL